MNSAVIVYSARDYDRHFFQPFLTAYEQQLGLHVKFVSDGLHSDTLHICQGATVVCLFVNDVVDKAMAQALSDHGIRLIVLRCAGTNNIDLEACQEAGVDVRNVPDYGPNSVAEHALSLILALNRKLHIANQRTKFGDFSLNCSLVGFESALSDISYITLLM
jgi:D-lactate dehydrogenase